LRLEVPLRPGEVEGTHEKIETALRASHYLNSSYLDAIPKLPIRRGERSAQILSREIAFRDACAEAIGRRSFTETLRSFSDDGDRLDESIARMAKIIDLDVSFRPDERDEIDDLLLAISPGLRIKMLDLAPEMILRMLALSELALRGILTLTVDSPRGPADAATPKGASDILSKLYPALRVLAVEGETFKARKGASRKLPPFGDPQMTFAAHRILRRAESGELTWPILTETLDTLPSVADRMALLTEISPLLKNDSK
jgi:hypothetical protein